MQGTRHLQLKLEVTRSVTYCSLAFSSLQQLLDFFFPEAGAALQLPVLCHVHVHHAQESICILLQLGCLPLKHKDGITALGGSMPPCCSRGTVASSDGCSYHSQLQGQKGEEWDNQGPAGMGSWNRMS